MRYFPFLLIFLLIFLLGVVAGCGFWDVISSPESADRLQEGGERVAEDPGLGTLVREGGEYLAWLLGAWVAGDRLLTARRRKLSDERKRALEVKLGNLEVQVNGKGKARS